MAGLDFYLTFHANTQLYTLQGGPLHRTFNKAEWLKFVTDQGCETYYERWAKEARENPATPIQRNPTSRKGKD